ncbi:MAG: hypothetical protein ABDH28_04065 [Brevinematia bacterium]
MKLRVLLFLVAFLIFLVDFSFAQTSNTNEGFLERFYRQEEAQGRGGWGIVLDVLNIILTLAIVIVVVYVALRFLKKAIGTPVDDFGVIEIMASKGITQGIAIYIVRIGKDYYVMSSGEKGLNLITKIEDRELINLLNVEKSKQASVVKHDFIDTFLSLFKKQSGDQSKADLAKGRIEFLRKQKDKLKSLE